MRRRGFLGLLVVAAAAAMIETNLVLAQLPTPTAPIKATAYRVTYRLQHIKFWRYLPEMASRNTIDQYNALMEYAGYEAEPRPVMTAVRFEDYDADHLAAALRAGQEIGPAPRPFEIDGRRVTLPSRPRSWWRRLRSKLRRA